jgi:aminoglycoside 3-N-acetyltransferase
MNIFTPGELEIALLPHRIRGDAVVMLHSSLLGLGCLDGVPLLHLPDRLIGALRSILGQDVTLVVPTFTFGFCDGEAFDLDQTPSRGMGALSEWVRRHPDACRSPHPIQSVAALGPRAATICNRHTDSAYGPGSSFESLLFQDAHILLLGCSFEAISLVHFLEERQTVPYRYWKSFTGPVRTNQREETRTAKMYVRDPDLGRKVSLQPIADLLLERDQLVTTSLGSSFVRSCRALHFARAGLDLLRRDPRALLTPSNTVTGASHGLG